MGECIINAEIAQKKWAAENGFTYSPENWELDILLAQLKAFKPDVFFSHDYVYLNPALRKRIREENPSIKYVFGWDGFGMNDKTRLEGCDMVLSCAQSILDFYAANGFATYLFNFGFEKSLLDRLQLNRNLHKVAFTGSVTVGNNMYNGRISLLAGLSRQVPTALFLSALTENKIYLAKSILKKLKAGQFGLVKDVLRLIQKNKGSRFGMDMYQTLADSRFTFNTHGDIVTTEAANVRLFEATGVGSCLVTDWKPNLNKFFEPDKEVVTYKSLDECVEKVKYLMEHEDGRAAIAKAGQLRTLTHHSYEKRIGDFLKLLESKIDSFHN